jgi:flagellar motility protein MotE (MotC chaperone)
MIAFQRWRRAVLLEDIAQHAKKELAHQLTDAEATLKRKTKKLTELQEDVKESEKQQQRLYKVVKQSKKTIADSEIEEERLSKEVNSLRSSRPQRGGEGI